MFAPASYTSPTPAKETFDELIYIVTKSIYSHKNLEFAFDLCSNDSYRPMHCSWFPSLALMNLMVIEKRYDEVVALFFERNSKLFESIRGAQEQLLPKHHLSLVCEALLLKGDRDSLEKLKKLVEIVYLKRCQLNNIGSICKWNLSLNIKIILTPQKGRTPSLSEI